MNKYIILIVSFILIGCTNSPKNSFEKKESNDTVPTIDINKQQDFLDFANYYSTDTLFQKNHTRFPLMITLRGTDYEEEDSVIYVEEDDWKPLSFEDCIINDIKYIHQLDTINKVITKLGIDCGIRLEYHFVNSDGQWKLTKIIDLSN